MDTDKIKNTPEEENTGRAEEEGATTSGKPVSTWRPQDADREIVKSNIRRRVWTSNASAKAQFIPAKPLPSVQDEGEKRVAVYARVSTKSTEQVSSIENQTRYYTEKIEKTPNWELYEIYSDEGISGVSIKKRPAFLRMIEDASKKEMNLILCASVSRFARNMSECLDQIQLLKTRNPSHPVGVYFETENIYTLDPRSSDQLQIHAMLADWESLNKSRRMILSYDQRISTGQYPVSDLLGYRHTEDGQLIIQEDEATTVRFIFLSYLVGYSLKEIAEILTEKARPTLKGNTEWNAAMVKNIMQNERRWGHLEARKSIVIDHKSKKVTKNNNTRDSAYDPEHHEGIVTYEIAKAVHMVAASGKALKGGLHDLHVIEEGALKGFICVCPAWSGMDNKTLQDICTSVYLDAEYEDLQYRAGILRGDIQSNIESLTFHGYEAPPGVYFMNSRTPSLTISKKSIKLNMACKERFTKHSHVEILYHPVLQVIALRGCSADTPNAVALVPEKANAPIATNSFTAAIYEKMEWISRYRFRFRGISRERGNSQIMLFFLDEPQILLPKKDRERIEAEETEIEQNARYIPYKVHQEAVITEENPFHVAYPEKWGGHHIGISYGLREQRNQLFSALTEHDLRIDGTAVLNPLIGKLPDRLEVENEVEQLLLKL